MGFICNEFSIKLVKIAQDNEDRDWLETGLASGPTHERSHEKHMLEVEQSFARLYFAT